MYPWVFLTIILTALVAVGVGMFISAIASSFTIALSVANPLNTLLMLYAGFLILNRDIPVYFRPFQYISGWYYSLAINMNLIYDNVKAPCPFPEVSDVTLKKVEDEMLACAPDKDKVRVWREYLTKT